jgi:hypothetical protein
MFNRKLIEKIEKQKRLEEEANKLFEEIEYEINEIFLQNSCWYNSFCIVPEPRGKEIKPGVFSYIRNKYEDSQDGEIFYLLEDGRYLEVDYST